MYFVRRIIISIFYIFILLGSFTLIYYFLNEDNREYLRVIFLNVGQGDSIFIEAPNGKQVLIDGGESSVVIRELSKVLPFYDKSIDMLIATHSDLDHIGGFPNVFKRYNVDIYSSSSKSANSGTYLELEKLSKKEQSDRIYLSAGDTIILDEESDIKLIILWPPKGVEFEDSNSSSIVSKLTYGETSFLLTGDAGKEEELSLLKMNIDSDVLKLGHHGSRNSSSELFISQVSPEYSIVSAGEGNKFGHPHSEVLNILKENKTEVLETSVLGSIIFKSDGNKIELVN
jgi:competence protein ComEC